MSMILKYYSIGLL